MDGIIFFNKYVDQSLIHKYMVSTDQIDYFGSEISGHTGREQGWWKDDENYS